MSVGTDACDTDPTEIQTTSHCSGTRMLGMTRTREFVCMQAKRTAFGSIALESSERDSRAKRPAGAWNPANKALTRYLPQRLLHEPRETH